MAVYKLFPSQDTTIYSEFPLRNSGLDEILSLDNNLNTIIVTGSANGQLPAVVNRALIQFDSSSLSSIFSSKIVSANWNAYLRLYLAQASALPTSYTLFAFPISQSWSQGTGRFDNIPETENGASWNYRTDTALWAITGSSFTSASFGSQSFSPNNTQDIVMDVTSIINQWVSGSIQNNGILIKHSASVEFNTGSLFDLKFFSRDTHTIYPPCLEFRYNDNSYTTGSNISTIVPSNNQIILSLGNNKGEYQQNSIQRFNINVRDKFPVRQFITSSIYLNNKFLPSQSYWAIKDLDTEEIVVDFDTQYTTINCDATSSYFRMFMDGLEPERYYRIMIKTVIGSETLIFDNEDLTFKVKR